MRIATAQVFRLGIDSIVAQQRELARTQLQIATGKRILTPSDDPAGAGRVLKLEEGIALGTQYRTNARAAAGRLAIEDTTLAAVTNLLQRVRELAVQGKNGTLTSADRQGLALEAQQRRSELLGLANAQDGNGEYLFAGYATGSRPFAANGTGTVSYLGDQGRREVRIGPQRQIATADPGSTVFQAIRGGNGVFSTSDNVANSGSGVIDAGSVFDPSAWSPDTYAISFPTTSTYEVRDGSGSLVSSGAFVSGGGGASIAFNGIEVGITGSPAVGDSFTVSTSGNRDPFASIQALVDALNDPESDGVGATRFHNAVNRALADVDQALEGIRLTRASIGGRINAIDAEIEVHEEAELHLRADLSKLEDADLATLITELNRQLATLQAAHHSFARLQNLSLFEFI